MLTAVLIAVLAVIAFAYVALPLLAPNQTDPLPDDRDPLLVDLQEEKAALFRAIRELDQRTDLAAARREELRARYEAKAARVLRAIDDREAELAGRARPRRQAPRRVPVGAVALLAIMVAAAAVLPTYVLPRIGQDATVTTTDVDAAQQLLALQTAARDTPNATNLLALGDAYLSLERLDDAEAAYRQVVETIEPVPAGAYQRMAILALQTDLAQAHEWLRLARTTDPFDTDTLFLLGEVAFARDDIAEALSAYRDYAAALGVTPPDDGAVGAAPEVDLSDPETVAMVDAIRGRLALLEELAPLDAAAKADPSEATLMPLADAYWRAGERSRAVERYFRVLTEFDAEEPLALGRTGQLLYASDRVDDAIGALERAAGAAGGLGALDLDSLLTLANAYLQTEAWPNAVDAYRAYLAAAAASGDATATSATDLATELLAVAEARAEGREPPEAGTALAMVIGQQVYVASCSQCHGVQGQGGAGPALAGNDRAANRANVLDAVQFGRGSMPAFQASLDATELEAVVGYVTDVLAPPR